MKLQKTISLMLALMLLLSVIPLQAGAAEVGERMSVGDASNVEDFEQDGDTYTINTAAGWEIFCDCLQDSAYKQFRNKTVKLGNDISVTRQAGSESHYFAGCFDGNHKTLTFNCTATDRFCAPFTQAYAGSSFRDLTVNGTISTDYYGASGLIGCMQQSVTIERCTSNIIIDTTTHYAAGFVGDCFTNVSFTDCVSNAVIYSTSNYSGGFVGRIRFNTTSPTFEGCVFAGKIVTSSHNSGSDNSGFVGFKNDEKPVVFNNCICAPAALADGEKYSVSNTTSGVFCYSKTEEDPSVFTNCYYFGAPLGKVQGKQAHAVTRGDHVTSLALSGTATVYPVSGITAYADNSGLQYGDTIYAGNEDAVTLALSHEEIAENIFSGYTASAGTMNDNVLTMPDSDTAVTASYLLCDAELSLGNNALTLPENVIQRCLFIPAEDGDYRFRSESNMDTWVRIYYGGALIAMDYDSGGNWQFDCITRLQGGKGYEVDICSPFAAGEANVSVASITMYDVTVDNSDPHGTINPENLSNGRAYAGQGVQFSYEADEGYILTGMTVTANGQSFEAEPYGFVMIDADVTVTPHFTKTYALIVSTDDHVYPMMLDTGSVIIDAGDAEIPAGTTASLHLYVEEGYLLDQITITGEDNTNVPYTLSTEYSEYVVTFTMPEQTVTVTVTSKARSVGDVDGNGTTDITDVTAIQKHLAELELLDDTALPYADTNGDNTVDIADATYLQMVLAGYIQHG